MPISHSGTVWAHEQSTVAEHPLYQCRLPRWGCAAEGQHQSQGLIAPGQGQDQGLGTQDHGQGLIVRGQGQVQGLAVQGQDQGLEKQDQGRDQLASTILQANAMSSRTPSLMCIKSILRTVLFCTPQHP